MSLASAEPLEIIESCSSNHGFNAATMGRECTLRATSRMSGDEPIVAFNLLSDPRDIQRMIMGVKFLHQTLTTAPVPSAACSIFAGSCTSWIRRLSSATWYNKILTPIGASLLDLSKLARKLLMWLVVPLKYDLDEMIKDDRGAVVDPQGVVCGVEKDADHRSSSIGDFAKARQNQPLIKQSTKNRCTIKRLKATAEYRIGKAGEQQFMTRLLEDFAQVSCDWFWEMDANLRFTYFSSRWQEVFGYSPEREIGRSRLEIAQNAEDKELWQAHLADLSARRSFRDLTYPYRHKDGYMVWLRVSGQPVFGPDGEFAGYRGVGTNVTAEIEAKEKLANVLAELKLANARLEKQNLLFNMALNNMSHGLCMWDSDLRVIVCNERFLEIYGFSADMVKSGTSLREVMTHSFELGNHPDFASVEELYATTATELAAGKELMVERQLSGARTMSVIYRSMADGSWIATYQDVTEQKRAEAQISYMAHHDALTGLPNRLLLRRNLQRDLDCLQYGSQLAVICLDLDGFKGVNDTWGHATGDTLLRLVTDRLLARVGPKDTVARLGGDEFVIVAAGIGNAEQAAALSSILVQSVSDPYDIDGQEIIVGASLGLALAPDHGIAPEDLLKRADLALYEAKDDGRGTFQFFEAGMEASQRARHALEQDIAKAIAEGQFELMYQPVVNTETEGVTSCEALLRWHHPDKGLIMPSDFISVAEETGLIVPLGEWVLCTACVEAMQWPADIRVSVNLSPVQFKRSDLLNTVIRALAVSGLSPQRLELELTESVLLEASEKAASLLRSLRALGITIAIDDFGMGYSSFGYLRKYAFDKIKIDRSFVKDSSLQADECGAFIRAIAGIGKSLGMVTTAEGVETPEQFDLVRNEGCTEVQGYLFGRPVTADQIKATIANCQSMSTRVG